ncbi:hypothetical protein [Thioalkalivibrio sp. HK1]|uniref:hypothetical protein n=1 Tax=Thioalkalivibrio sp. HK1 TaxID=1469245 RepID=UPI000472F3BB|nr:hypothetical protein [Thioalkalivibrio sp. HK1]
MTIEHWIAIAGLALGIIIPIIGLMISRANKTDAKIDTLSAQLSSMGYDISGRVGRLEGKAQVEQERPESKPSGSSRVPA